LKAVVIFMFVTLFIFRTTLWHPQTPWN